MFAMGEITSQLANPTHVSKLCADTTCCYLGLVFRDNRTNENGYFQTVGGDSLTDIIKLPNDCAQTVAAI
jgi:hypothetical protein